MRELDRLPDLPLNEVLWRRTRSFPALAQGRDLFNDDFFRVVRNGFGRWSFVWRDAGHDPQIDIIDWKTGAITATLTLLAAEALHVSFSMIEALDREVLERASPRSAGD